MTSVSEQPTDPAQAPGQAVEAPPREVPPPPVTGDPGGRLVEHRVAAAAGLPLEAQVEAYEYAHRALQSRLADVEG